MANKYKAAMFDVGMTLIYPPLDEPFLDRLHDFGVDADIVEIGKALHFTDQHFFKNYPGVLNQPVSTFYEYYASIMFAYLHIDKIEVHEFKDLMLKVSPPRSIWKVYPETLECLGQLRKAGVKVGIFSNWDLSLRELLDKMGITPYCDSIVVSSEIESEKPQPKGFLLGCDELGVEPEECVYVGDNHRDDVLGGNAVGMDALLINRSDKPSGKTGGRFVEVKDLYDVVDIVTGIRD